MIAALRSSQAALEGDRALSLDDRERSLETGLYALSIRARMPAEHFAAEAVELRLAPALGARCHLVNRFRESTESQLSLAGLDVQ